MTDAPDGMVTIKIVESLGIPCDFCTLDEKQVIDLITSTHEINACRHHAIRCAIMQTEEESIRGF